MQPSTINYNRIAAEYVQNRRLHPRVFENLLATGQPQTGDRILEVGCGTGNYIIALNEALDCLCWSIDPSAGMVDRAKARSESINFQLGQAGAVGLRSDRFKLVFSVDVIHHVSDPFSYFQEAFRVLEPGGKICTVTDSETIIRRRQPLATYFPDTIEPELKRYHPLPTLCKLMWQAGFQQIIEHTVELSYKIDDVRAYRDKAFSALHLISAEAFERGLNRMRQDLQAGPIQGVSQYVLLWGTK